jgi:hypothetical protein
MTSATVQINVIPKRMLTEAESAHHCGRPVKRFKCECDVSPVCFPNGDKRWDVHDLDDWLDRMKANAPTDADQIVSRLG